MTILNEYSIIISAHALSRMFERGIDPSIIKIAIADGSVIKNYPDDKPFPSRLILFFHDGKPIHILEADDKDNKIIYIITIYNPDPAKWNEDYTIRR